jgi:hypothetical protein
VTEPHPAYDQVVEDLEVALNNLQLREARIARLERDNRALREEVEQRRRDMADMNSSPQTLFVRCACGRIRSQGLICPTNAEGGDCEAGR